MPLSPRNQQANYKDSSRIPNLAFGRSLRDVLFGGFQCCLLNRANSPQQFLEGLHVHVTSSIRSLLLGVAVLLHGLVQPFGEIGGNWESARMSNWRSCGVVHLLVFGTYYPSRWVRRRRRLTVVDLQDVQLALKIVKKEFGTETEIGTLVVPDQWKLLKQSGVIRAHTIVTGCPHRFAEEASPHHCLIVSGLRKKPTKNTFSLTPLQLLNEPLVLMNDCVPSVCQLIGIDQESPQLSLTPGCRNFYIEYYLRGANACELSSGMDLKSLASKGACGFDSRPGHQTRGACRSCRPSR